MDASDGETAHADERTDEVLTKVKRTYGRKRNTTGATVDGASSSVLLMGGSSSSVANSSVIDELKLSSALKGVSGDSFGWKKHLADIDHEFDQREAARSSDFAVKSFSGSRLRESMSMYSTSTEDDSFIGQDDSLLSNSLPPLASSSQTDLSPFPSKPKRGKNRAVATSDGSDNEGEPGAKASSPTSPLFPHPINTPKLRSSPTPPSSDAESENPEPSKNPSSVSARSKRDVRHGSAGPSAGSRRRTGGGKPEEKSKKLKKLSKKEERDSKKAHARIMVEQLITVPKKSEHLTINNLLGKIQHSTRFPPSAVKLSTVSSDPIQEFTSSPLLLPLDTVSAAKQDVALPALQDESDEELPEVHEVLQKQEMKRRNEEAESQRKTELALIKRRAVEAQGKHSKEIRNSDTDDEDLEIVEDVINVEQIPKRSAKAKDYEKKLAGVAGFRVKAGRNTFPENLEGSQGENVLKRAAKAAFEDRHARRTSTAVNHKDLQSILLNRASKQGMQVTKEKEVEWVRRGGKLQKQRGSEPLSLEQLAEKLAQKNTEKGGITVDTPTGADAGSDDGSDEDWEPENRGSASPTGSGSPRDSNAEEELEGDEEGEAENDPVKPQEEVDEEANKTDTSPEHRQQPRRSTHYASRLVVSDSEEEGQSIRHPKGRVLVPDTSMIFEDPAGDYMLRQTLAHRGSASSTSESTPDEDNKENDTRLMFDHGEDKENHVVPRHVPAGRPRGLGNHQPSSIFDLEEGARRLSMSPGAASEDPEARGGRKALQTKKPSALGDPFAFSPPLAVANSESPKISRTTPKSVSASPKLLPPAFGQGMGGFSQLFNDEESSILAGEKSQPAGVLQPAFRVRTNSSEDALPLQPSFQPKAVEIGGLSDMFSPEPERRLGNRLKRPGNVEELSLSLDAGLQPALQVTTQVRRKADAIFEKEQNFLLDEATSTRPPAKSELYVTENGLLTQTKPDVSTPLIYRSWTPTQKAAAFTATQGTAPPSSMQRMPLSTLSFTSDIPSSSQPQRLARLVKGKQRAHSPSDESVVGESFAVEPSRTMPPNAFEEMLKAARKKEKKEKKKLERSEFIEGEAQESDEDEMFGFGGRSKDDGEESDEDDPNAVVEGLVDDAAMDAEQIAEEKVLEKVKEQLEQDDAALQKYHQSAIEGKFRGKRRGGGIAMDDSDSDDNEDDEARRLRRRMHKKRRIDGDSLEALGKDEKSRPFYDAYQRDIEEDDNEDFAHLTKDEMDVSDEGDEGNDPETISTTEIHERLREAARENKGREREYHVFDPEDVEWAQPIDLSDEEVDVKEDDTQPKKITVRKPVFGQQTDFVDFDSQPKFSSNWNNDQLDAWRKEQSGRNLGTGGMRGAITVTGHGSKDNRGGTSASASTSRTFQHAAGGERLERRKVVKTASILASVTDKQSRFGL